VSEEFQYDFNITIVWYASNIVEIEPRVNRIESRSS